MKALTLWRLARAAACAALVAAGAFAAAAEPVSFSSPGLPPSSMDSAGRLAADWGTFGVRLAGEGVAEGPVNVEAVKLEDLVPAARATADRGAVRLICTAYRAPVFPSGLDVFTARVEEAKGEPCTFTLALELPEQAQRGMRTVRLGNRIVLGLPADATAAQTLREWGYCDEAASLPGWANPAVPCDEAFKNIRAGMGGVSIAYRFAVRPKSAATVALGLCESHWAEAAQRPLVCRVEGAVAQEVDPVSKWGRHQPGVLVFKSRDENGDGRLDVVVRAAPQAPDQNPILNAIWIFPPGKAPDPAELIAGKLSAAATYYVDVGGPNDQSLYSPGAIEYKIELPAGGSRELTFLAACSGTSVPSPDASAWTPVTLYDAAADVWRDWPAP
jgi:hypothetical protein